MKLSTTRVLTAAVAVPLALLTTACGGGGGGQQAAAEGAASMADVKDSDLNGLKISVGDFFGDCIDEVGTETDVTKATNECQAMRILNNKFNAENPYGITVTREGGAEWKSYYDAVNAAFAAKKPPNVLLMHESNIPDYSSRGLLLPLETGYKATGIGTSDMTEPAQAAAEIDGTLYAVPIDEHASLSHVNLDLMAKAGLVKDGKPVLPTSPEELKQQAQKFQQATGKQYIAWGNDFNIPFRIFSSFVAQQGDPVVTDKGKVNIDTPAGKAALGLISDLYSAGIADPQQTYDAAQQAFLNGDVGILINGTWVVNEYNNTADFTYLATDFPTVFDQPGVWANSHTFVIPVQTDANGPKYRAAMEYAAFMYKNDISWALPTGHLPVRPSVLSSAKYLEATQRENYIDTADNAALVPQVRGWQGAEDALQHAIEGVWLTGTPVDKALAQAQKDVEAQLKG